MLNQLIEGFGTSVCTCVRKRFPCGPKVTGGAKKNQPVSNLKNKTELNSLIPLTHVETPNDIIIYRYQKSMRSVDFCFDLETNKMTVTTRYCLLKSEDWIVKYFYVVSEYEETPTRPQRQNNLIGKAFEAYDSNFEVTNTYLTVICTLIESGSAQYRDGTNHSFEVSFVRQKINQYLECLQQ